MANILHVERAANKITLGATGTTINIASHTASTILGLDASKDLESLAIPLIVANGGTGLATITDGGLLLGSGTGAITPLAQATNGQLPIGNTGANCVLAILTGTANQVIVTNGAGSITLSTPQDIHTTANPTFAGLILVRTGAGDATQIFETASHQVNVYLDESMVTDKLIFAGQTAAKDTIVDILALDGYFAALSLTSGSALSYIQHSADDDLKIANTVSNKDLILEINDGGATKTIIWDADVDTLIHSAGIFNFNSGMTIGDGGTTNYTEIKTDGEINLHGTAKVMKSVTFVLNYRNITAQGKPTLVNQGVFYGFSLPVYNNDDEELFTCRCMDGDWDDTTDPIIYAGGWLDTANDTKKFKLQVSVETADYAGNAIVPVTTNDYETETTTGTWAQYASFKVAFTIDASAIGLVAGQPLAIRIRRVAASADEIAGEVIVEGAAMVYTANKLGIAT